MEGACPLHDECARPESSDGTQIPMPRVTKRPEVADCRFQEVLLEGACGYPAIVRPFTGMRDLRSDCSFREVPKDGSTAQNTGCGNPPAAC